MMLLHNFLDYQARDYPDLDFAIYGDEVMSYEDARLLSNRIGNAVIGLGLEKGDRIAYLSKNAIEYPVLMLGCSRAGVAPVPLNYRLAPLEWKYIIDDSAAKALVVSQEYLNDVITIKDQLETVEHFIVIGDEASEGFESFYPWIHSYPNTPPEREVLPDDDLYQMYTSGTTGNPKGAVLTHCSVTMQIHQFQYRRKRDKGERNLIVAPMYHTAAATTAWGTMAAAGTLVIKEAFDPVDVVRELSEGDIVHVTLVPAMIQACLVAVPDAGERSYDALQTISYGASPIAEETLRKAMEVFDCEFWQGYGMTETTAVLAQLSHDDHLKALDGNAHLLLAAGRPILATEVKIVDDDGKEVPNGTVGEIIGRGPQIMSGYWNMPEATEKALEGGWMHTGDAGRMDDEGYIYIEDRVKDMIISGGENIYPAEIENIILQHPGVGEAAVIGQPSDKWGESPLAIVVKKDDSITGQDIIGHCKGKLAPFKMPK
ncbi:MAG: AMP-binding protein, partial [Candidatus Hydrogenedentota bacterium]